jgi:hypothetical protein
MVERTSPGPNAQAFAPATPLFAIAHEKVRSRTKPRHKGGIILQTISSRTYQNVSVPHLGGVAHLR